MIQVDVGHCLLSACLGGRRRGVSREQLVVGSRWLVTGQVASQMPGHMPAVARNCVELPGDETVDGRLKNCQQCDLAR
jgi:hypothetical protein